MPDDAQKELTDRYRERLPLLKKLAVTLQGRAVETLDGLRHVDRVSFRAKSVDSFIGKCLPEKGNPRYEAPLRQVEDQVAGRVLVQFPHDVGLVHERLASSFNLVEADRKAPVADSEFGYESDHLIVSIAEHLKPTGWDGVDDMPVTFELQIRTLFMHAWAEPQHDLAYKPAAELTREDRRAIAFIAASAWGADRDLETAWRQSSGGRSCN